MVLEVLDKDTMNADCQIRRSVRNVDACGGGTKELPLMDTHATPSRSHLYSRGPHRPICLYIDQLH